MKKAILWCILCSAAAVVCLAQGSGSVATPPSVSGADGSPFQVTRSLTGVVREISIEKGILIVEDAKNKQAPVELKLAAKVRVGGKRSLAEIMPGMLLRVQYAASEAKTALEIRILEKGGV